MQSARRRRVRQEKIASVKWRSAHAQGQQTTTVSRFANQKVRATRGASGVCARHRSRPCSRRWQRAGASLYADIGGPGSVAAPKMAVGDFNPAQHNMKVDVVSADHQNKPDIGSGIARQWYDTDHVDDIVDVPNSGVALAVSGVIREKNKVFLISGAADSDLTGKQCSPNSVHWTYDTWSLAHGTGDAIVKNGGKTWFFITADYAFGHALERDTSAVVAAAGGKVLGAVRAPLNTADFSSYLLQAQSS